MIPKTYYYIQDDNGEPGFYDRDGEPIALSYKLDAEAWCKAKDAGIYSITTVKPLWRKWKPIPVLQEVTRLAHKLDMKKWED